MIDGNGRWLLAIVAFILANNVGGGRSWIVNAAIVAGAVVLALVAAIGRWPL